MIDEAAKVRIRTAQLLLAMYYALQPGVFALSGWDLCGVLTLPTDAVADLLDRGRTTQTPFSTNFARTRRPGPGRRSPVRGIRVVRRPHDPIDRVGSVRPQPLSRCRRHTGVGEGPADADGDAQDSVSPDHRSSTRFRHPADAGCAEGDDPRA